ncbi:lysozyme inhibitor LprI family protein [Xanthobacter autotrophicus DSM 431]|uniref:lysozyme inhibitor LprI family protein n=1 Tax=Xanthobacter nonsaccharivorans TaxID=3119912 RepID=UPI00372C8941
MRRSGFSLLLFVLLATSASGAEPSAEVAVARCLTAAEKDGTDPHRCTFIYADACVDRAEDPSTVGQVACYEREAAVWDAKLNELYRKLMAGMSAEKTTRLRESERSWIEARKQTCSFYSVFYEGGTMALPMAAACNTRQTSERVLFLKGFADEVGQDPH